MTSKENTQQCVPQEHQDNTLRGTTHFARVFSGFGFFALKQNPYPAPAPCFANANVETVEKVPFQKLIFEKWDRNIEKRLVIYVLNDILAIFEPVAGDSCEIFSNKGFFDSLVSPHLSS